MGTMAAFLERKSDGKDDKDDLKHYLEQIVHCSTTTRLLGS